MASRPVQISLDVELLKRVDRDEETRAVGRSALIRHALEYYLEAKRRRSIDVRLKRAYARVPRPRCSISSVHRLGRRMNEQVSGERDLAIGTSAAR